MRDIPIPIFTGGLQGMQGVIFRPGSTTRILCGSASDTGGGACLRRCPSATLADDYDPIQDGRDGCFPGSWSPEDFGVFLYRYARWQREVQANGHWMDYNEIIVDGPHWTAHLPSAIEAFFFGVDQTTSALARQQHGEFLAAFNLTNEEVPLLTIDTHDWRTPFRLAPAAE